jgi:hypothetical protein
LAILFLCLLFDATLFAQKTEIEAFEKVDPYTKGERAALDRAGYVNLGPFSCSKHTSAEIVATLGDVPIIFIETAHFRLASTLASYKPPGDRSEKEALEREFAELKKKLPKFMVPTKIDPWLRAHLYAQRLETLYADFAARFGLRDDDFTAPTHVSFDGRAMGVGPYFGQKEKYFVLLSQTRSALGRYLKTYVGLENEYAYRAKYPDCYFFGANFEALKDGGRELDIAFYSSIAGAMAQNFVDAFRDSNQAAPVWFGYGIAHYFGRNVDARWNQWNAGGETSPDDDKAWFWEPRVLGLVKNDVSPSWDAMMGWTTLEEIKPRDHMICWSRVDWMLSAKKSDARALLFGFSDAVAGATGPERSSAIRDQELRVYQSVWKQTPAEVERAWRTWIEKAYPKREPER